MNTETNTDTEIDIKNVVFAPLKVYQLHNGIVELISGQVYVDISGQEKLAWQTFDHVGSNPFDSGERKISNEFGTPLLYIGYRNSQTFNLPFIVFPAVKFLYFLSGDRIIGTDVGYSSLRLKDFIQIFHQKN